MKKELLILVYKINTLGLSYQQVDEIMKRHLKQYSLQNDIELKENYIIREIFLPINEGNSDVNIIYPFVTSLSKESCKLINEINDKIKNEYVGDELKKKWTSLFREIKIKNVESYVE